MVKDRVSRTIACVLIVSGMIHLGLWLASGQAWEGAVSLRKPALFGISTGVTVWSLAWVLECVQSQDWERRASRWIGWALLVEVVLITLQFWRGVPSHFNENTNIDAAIEGVMLLLVLVATVWVGWLWFKVRGPVNGPRSMTLAIRSGMMWLLVSCLLGIGTTALGKWNLMHGKPYDVWGQAGVLKFPHGIALHAIQFLPLAAWLLERWRVRNPYLIVQGLTGAQLCLVLFALWQTLQGRGRTDVDGWGLSFLLAACIWLGVSIVRSQTSSARPYPMRD